LKVEEISVLSGAIRQATKDKFSRGEPAVHLHAIPRGILHFDANCAVALQVQLWLQLPLLPTKHSAH
jgi:hypothetical protein